MVKNITIFTTNTCASCAQVKKYLDMKSHQYDVINLDDHPERQAEALAISGALTVPITVLTRLDDSQQVVIGPNFAKLAPALA